MQPKPALVADVRASIVRLDLPFAERRFGLLLRRRSLLTLTLVGAADALDRLDLDAAHVLQSHWFGFADRALYDPFFLRTRALHDPPLAPPEPDEPAVLDFPYVLDLARLASLMSLQPWQTAAGNGNGAESVEAFRQRVARIVSLYADGLGTLDALRRMTEAQLPVDLDAAPELRDRPFSLEERAALTSAELHVTTPGEPVDLLGPLMHWRVDNDGALPVPPTVYVQAPTPEERAAALESGPVDDAVSPLIERFDPTASALAIGVAYAGTIAPGRTLRLRPTFAPWLGAASGLRVAHADSATDADPAAPGPWAAAPGAPARAVTALLQTSELALWVAVGDDDGGTLWRHDGSDWTLALDGVAPIRRLVEDGDDLLLAGDDGVRRLQRFRGDDDAFTATGVVAFPVHDLLLARDGTRWLATGDGVFNLGDDGTVAGYTLGATTDVRCLA